MDEIWTVNCEYYKNLTVGVMGSDLCVGSSYFYSTSHIKTTGQMDMFYSDFGVNRILCSDGPRGKRAKFYIKLADILKSVTAGPGVSAMPRHKWLKRVVDSFIMVSGAERLWVRDTRAAGMTPESMTAAVRDIMSKISSAIENIHDMRVRRPRKPSKASDAPHPEIPGLFPEERTAPEFLSVTRSQGIVGMTVKILKGRMPEKVPEETVGVILEEALDCFMEKLIAADSVVHVRGRAAVYPRREDPAWSDKPVKKCVCSSAD